MIEDRGSQGGIEQEKGQFEGADVKVNFRSGTPELRNKYIDMGIAVLMEQPQS